MKIKTYLSVGLFLLLLGFILVKYGSFAKGTHDSVKNNLLHHKEFMKSVSVKGTVLDKKTCSNCEHNKYQVIFELPDLDIDSIRLGDRSYPPYYTFTFKKLNLSVSKVIYDNISVGDTFVKQKKSSNLKIGNHSFLYLSKDEYDWIASSN